MSWYKLYTKKVTEGQALTVYTNPRIHKLQKALGERACRQPARGNSKQDAEAGEVYKVDGNFSFLHFILFIHFKLFIT